MRCWRATIPTIQAVILLFSLVYVLINLLVDLTYTLSTRGSAIERRARPAEPAETAAPPPQARPGAAGSRATAASSSAPSSSCSWSLIGLAGAVARHHRPLRDQPGVPQQACPAPSRRIRNDDGTAARFTLPHGHRQPRPRRLQPRRLRRARVADHRHHGRGASASRSASSSAWSPATSAGSTASSCASWTG